MKKFLGIISLLLSLSINIFVDINIFNGNYYPALVIFWLISIILLLLYSIDFSVIKLQKFELSKKNILILFIILLPLLVRIINLEEKRIHQDAFITGYFSATHNFQKINFFSAIPQDQGEWVSQYPTPFFIFQKMFFLLFGANQWTVKLSVMPYIFITSLMLFLITKEIFDKKLAIISLLLYSFFAASLYLDTLGLHIASSDTVYMIFIYFSILTFRHKTAIYPILAGIFCSFCYLSYQGSYIAFPVALIFLFVEFFREKQIAVFKKYFLLIFSFFLTLSPFLIYNFKSNNYMFKRFPQISFVKEAKNQSQKPNLLFRNNFKASLESLYKDGIGGDGGYHFGHLALFEKISLVFFLGGVVISLILVPILVPKKTEFLIILAGIIAAFFGGVVINNMPPNVHRLGIIFPSISIISALPLYYLAKSKIINNKLAKFFILFVLIVIYSINNLNYFLKMVKADKDQRLENFDHVKVIDYIKENFPDRPTYIAAYPSLALKKIYYFFDPGRNVKIDYHDNFLKNFNKDEKYVYIILFPDQFEEKFSNADPNGRIIHGVSTVYSLFVN